MRKKIVQFVGACLAAALALPLGLSATPVAHAHAGVEETLPVARGVSSSQMVRVGLAYGSGSLDGANLANEVGSGYRLGYFNQSNQFVSLGYTSETAISVVETLNVYYGRYNGYTSYHEQLTSSSVAVGCYHTQLPGSYATFDKAYSVASRYSGGFVAYIGGLYFVRVGNFTSRPGAVQMQSTLKSMYGISATIVGTSEYGVSVVKTGTNTILFQYDDKGSGTGLGVMPDRTGSSSTKAVTWFRGMKYYGGFRYERIGGGDLTVVNILGLEDYVKGVVPTEMSASWDREALKAQAVCARTYVMANLGRHSGYHFDVCPDVDCQAYTGRQLAKDNSDAAVDETAGQVGTYNGRYASMVYYSSNGGASESSSVVWGSNQSSYPYLVGKVDPYEATITIPGYNWTKSFTGDELKSKIGASATIVSVKISSLTDSGNPLEVAFTDKNGKVYRLSASKMVRTFGFRSYRYQLADAVSGSVKVNGQGVSGGLSGMYAVNGSGGQVSLGNSAYVITDGGVSQVTTGTGESYGKDGVFTFAGAGWGHNVGMSQYGALAMAKQGCTYREILSFYYTGITVS